MRENNTVNDGFTKAQEKQLRSRKKSDLNVTDEGKWREIYRILFPDDDPAMIPSPCEHPRPVVLKRHRQLHAAANTSFPDHEDMGIELGSDASGSGTPAAFAAFARREFPRFVRRELDVLFQSEFQDVEERVRPRIQDIVLNLQPRLIALYEQSVTDTESSREQAVLDLATASVPGEGIETEEVQIVESPAPPITDMHLDIPTLPLDANFDERLVVDPWLASPSPGYFPDFNFDWNTPLEGLYDDPARRIGLPQQGLPHQDGSQGAGRGQPLVGTWRGLRPLSSA
jgi:hypothetical protein